MNALLASSLDVARQLAAAVPTTWRGDRVFRWAAMGTGLTLGMLLLGATESRRLAPPAPQEVVQGVEAPTPSLLPSTASEPPQRLTGAAGGSSPSSAPAVPVIAPGQPLGAVPPPLSSGSDRFGTVAPQQQTSGPRP